MKGITAGQEYLEFLPVGAQPTLGSPGVLAWALAVGPGNGAIKLSERGLGRAKTEKQKDTK